MLHFYEQTAHPFPLLAEQLVLRSIFFRPKQGILFVFSCNVKTFQRISIKCVPGFQSRRISTSRAGLRYRRYLFGEQRYPRCIQTRRRTISLFESDASQRRPKAVECARQREDNLFAALFFCSHRRELANVSRIHFVSLFTCGRAISPTVRNPKLQLK